MSIVVENIVKLYGNQVALDNVNFKVHSGEIVGFLGPNGAGKSTMMKILTGYLPANKGIAWISGQKVSADNTEFRSKIGYLPEQNPLYPEMYIREYLAMVAGFYKLKNINHLVKEVIEMTGLSPESSKKIGALSKGYKQRVGLAQALIHNPEVLILDEPTTGLDPNQLDEIRSLIKDISKDKTVLLSTHIMQEVEALCNRIIIINNGKIVADDTTEEIKKWSKRKGQQVVFAVKENISETELSSLPFVAKVDKNAKNEYVILSSIEEDIRPKLFEATVKNNWTLLTMAEQSNSVESIFRELTQL
jgi:ABC-2 type transport system ATP-binding protein